MHLLLTDRGSEPFLIAELRRAFPHPSAEVRAPGLVVTDLAFQPELPPTLVFTRQFLPNALPCQANSISRWAQSLAEALPGLPENQPWHLHIMPRYGSGPAGRHRCQLIRQTFLEILRHKHRHLLRALRTEARPFTPEDSLVQVLLTAPDRGFLSLAVAPLPFQWRRVIWPFPEGEIPVAIDNHVLERLKHALPPLCDEFHLTRLCANKNEVCAFGTLAVPSP